MREVTIEKGTLQKLIETNREQHREQYQKAFDGYAAAMRRALEENLSAFQKNAHHRVLITEAPPEDHTKDYDVILEMLALEVDDEVTIDQGSFRQYVKDEWGWKVGWTVSNSKYLAQ